MREAWLLFRIQFRSRFSLKELSGISGSGSKAAAKRAGMLLLVFIGFGSILMMYCMMLYGLLKAAIDFGYPELVMDLVVLVSMVMCAVFGIFIIMSNIYLAKDTAFLYSLPVRSKSIFVSKFMLVYLSELLINLFFMLPAAIIYGSMAGGNAAFYFRALYVTLLMPAIPLLAALLLDSLLMLVVGRLRRRELFTTIGSFIMIAAILVGQFYLNSTIASSESAGEDFFANLFDTSWTKLQTLSVPPVSWASKGIVGGGYTSLFTLILFTITVLLFLIIVYYAAGAIYRRAAVYNLEAAKKYKKTAVKAFSERSQSAVMAIYKKEWKILLRSAIYATNSLAGVVVAVIAVIFPAFSGDSSEMASLLAKVDAWTATLLLAGAIGFFSSLNLGATTAVSREGKAFWLIKALPVSYRKQTLAKLVFGITIPVLWGLPLAVAFVFIFRMPVAAALLGFILGMVVSVAITALGMIFDFAKPKLSWTNEAEAIKQNMNGVIAMVLGAAAVGVLAVAGYLLLAKAGLAMWAVCVVLTAVSAAFAAVSVWALLRAGEKALDRLEA